MSFYGTPLKHGKGVNKPFRSPFLKNDLNEDKGDGTPISRKLSNSRINQNSRTKSLGSKTPISTRGFISPLKPLGNNSSSNSIETEMISKSSGYSSPVKQLRHNALSKRLESNFSLSENNSPMKLSSNNLLSKLENLSEIVTSKEKNLSPKLKLPSNHLAPKINEDKSPKTPSTSPKINKEKSPEYQPVVKLQRLNSQLLASLNKKDLAKLIRRISDKQREMVELRAKMPTIKKHNQEEIVTSIEIWREAFTEALETLRESLTEKHGQTFSTSDVLKLLSIPNNIVHFSEENNDYIFPKI